MPLLAINDDGEVSSDSDEKKTPHEIEMGNYRSNDVDKSVKQTIDLSISFINEESISFSDFSDLEPQN